MWKGPKPLSPSVLQTEGLRASHKPRAVSTTVTLWGRKTDIETEHVIVPDLPAGGWVVGLGTQSPLTLLLAKQTRAAQDHFVIKDSTKQKLTKLRARLRQKRNLLLVIKD